MDSNSFYILEKSLWLRQKCSIVTYRPDRPFWVSSVVEHPVLSFFGQSQQIQPRSGLCSFSCSRDECLHSLRTKYRDTPKQTFSQAMCFSQKKTHNTDRTTHTYLCERHIAVVYFIRQNVCFRDLHHTQLMSLFLRALPGYI